VFSPGAPPMEYCFHSYPSVFSSVCPLLVARCLVVFSPFRFIFVRLLPVFVFTPTVFFDWPFWRLCTAEDIRYALAVNKTKVTIAIVFSVGATGVV